MRRTTVLGGIALGLVLVAALTLTGAIGLDPLPGFDEHRVLPSGGAISATQPEVRRSLLDPRDLPPGYSVVPAAPPAPGVIPAPGVLPTSPGIGPLGPGLLPDLGLDDLPLDEGILGPPGDGPPGDGPRDHGNPGGPGAGTPGGGRPEAGPAEPVDLPPPAEDRGDATARCTWLLAAPWRLAAAGQRPVAPPQVADHTDDERGVRLRQVLGGFAGDGAERGLARFRRTTAECSRFRVPAPAGREGDHRRTNRDQTGGNRTGGNRGSEDRGSEDRGSEDRTTDHRPSRHGERAGARRAGPQGERGRPGRRPVATVTLEPLPRSDGPDTGWPGDDGYAVRVSIATRDGRAWTGYLSVDRVGHALSVLWHLGPRGAITPAEAAATRRAAVEKARPLSGLVGR